jgi:two-component system, NarL family, sensor kinase
MLSGIKHSFAALKNQVTMDNSLDNKFSSNIDKLNDTIKELRNISHSISPDGLLLYGLENSLRDYCNNITSPGVLNISFKALDTEKMLLTEDQAFHSFRIIQELLQNILKHSGASNAIVQISYNHNRLYITVEDDGKGFEIGDDGNRKGMGLKNIENRIKILKGKMDYRTTASDGTSVLMEIPCAEKNI